MGEGFAAFRPHMRRVFLRNYDAYVKALEAYRPKEGSCVRSPIWNFQVRYKIQELLTELEEMKAKLAAEEPEESAAASSDKRPRDESAEAEGGEAAKKPRSTT